MAIRRERDDLWWVGQAWEDYLYWQQHDLKIAGAINSLIKEIRRDPFRGLGKPEALKANGSGWWSRRITKDDRLVYRLFDMDKPRKGQAKPEKVTVIQIAQCRYHYDRY
jgi:toxin YoeB